MDLATIKRRFGIVGESPLIQQAVERLVQVAPTDLSVLITGESGTGKDVFARALHGLSKRSGRRLVSLNCGAIPENLLESELFGHERGAFTGAVERRKGYFEAADGGTIFLDEIGEMPIGTQVKLLRVLESGEFSRVGSSDTLHTDVRVLAATNRTLEQDVVEGLFRQDLYFRLNAVQIHLPPLRERPEDIGPLVEMFGRSVAAEHGFEYRGISDEALQFLKNLPWQGNVRELRNMIVTITTLERGDMITPATIRPYVPRALKAPGADIHHGGSFQHSYSGGSGATLVHLNGKTSDQVERELIYKTVLEIQAELRELKQALFNREDERRRRRYELPPIEEADAIEDDASSAEEEFDLERSEEMMIRRALDHVSGNRRKAAEVLGISERTLYRRLVKFGLI